MVERKFSHENELPIGTSSFQEMIIEARKNRLQIVDKTFFIEQVIGSNDKVMLFTRPRRFGKSTNLSMLYYFLSDENSQENRELFKELKVESSPETMAEQGKYPVIMLNLKDLKIGTLEEYDKWLAILFSDLYRRWQPVLIDFLVESSQKGLFGFEKDFNDIMARQAEPGVLQNSLKQLTYYIYSATGNKPWILIDEYDGAIYNAFTHGYHRAALETLSKVLGTALKDNENFHQAVVTGVLRIVKESIFSGLNNISVYSFQTPQYIDAFGFTEQEVRHLIEQRPSPMETHERELEELSAWYNGYECGGVTLYNPWSIACYMKSHQFLPYWTNTGGDGILRTLLAQGDYQLKESFSQLLLNGQVDTPISEFLDFQILENDPEQVWRIMVASGYLKVLNPDPLSELEQTLVSPNYELTRALKAIAASILTQSRPTFKFIKGLTGLLKGDPIPFINGLQNIFEESVSFHDLRKGGENFTQGVLLGIVAILNDQFAIRSNRESGDGRYDIALFPRKNNLNQSGIIIELKMVRGKNKEIDKDIFLDQLKEVSQKAIEQIIHKNYVEEFRQQKVGEVLAVGIAFGGKYLEGSSCRISLN